MVDLDDEDFTKFAAQGKDFVRENELYYEMLRSETFKSFLEEIDNTIKDSIANGQIDKLVTKGPRKIIKERSKIADTETVYGSKGSDEELVHIYLDLPVSIDDLRERGIKITQKQFDILALYQHYLVDVVLWKALQSAAYFDYVDNLIDMLIRISL